MPLAPISLDNTNLYKLENKLYRLEEQARTHGFYYEGYVDSDRDGLSDYDEMRLGTDPYDADTDGDGYSDGWEVDHGYDPFDADDGPD